MNMAHLQKIREICRLRENLINIEKKIREKR